MMIQPSEPITPHPEVNAMLALLISGVQQVLGDQLLAFYLDGSLATGAFDPDSDIDFVVVTHDEPSEALFGALQDLHERLAAVDSPWAIQLEGSYLSRRAIWRYDPRYTRYPNIERGRGEVLKIAVHDTLWDVHRAVLRQHGITILGPSPQVLIDAVSPQALRQAMRPVLYDWGGSLRQNPAQITHRGYQSYIVLTLCRAAYTLATGAVASKPDALRWAQKNLPARWSGLLDRAWIGRHASDQPPEPGEVQETLDFLAFLQAEGRDP